MNYHALIYDKPSELWCELNCTPGVAKVQCQIHYHLIPVTFVRLFEMSLNEIAY